MPNRRPHDHLLGTRFRIEIEGVTQSVGTFTAVEGLEVSVDVVSYADGSDLIGRKRPGRIHYGNIVLKRGFIHTDELWNWFKAVIDGKIERKAGSVIVCGDDGSEIMRYNFFEGWPCRWKNFSLDASFSRTLVEELEIAVEKIERG
jgi:phage tail-like protein